MTTGDPEPPAHIEPENATPPPAPEPHKVTLNAGMLLPVRLVDGLSSEHAAPGDAFPATLDKELVVDGFAIAERGAVWGRLLICGRVVLGLLAFRVHERYSSSGRRSCHGPMALC